ncbi:MAG: hypothetical protein HY708_00450 [Ignavibacteriae bacterium]|nr:hypothetical protein [Ignavibacteriota bacterium]
MQRVPADASWVVLVLGVLCQISIAQTTLNPDISVIPRFVMETNDGEELAAGRRRFSRPDFAFQELEMAISSYLNPFARADVVLTLPGPDIGAGKLGLEELYATVVRGLPLDLNIRFGKYRVEYGKLNIVHPHAWPFVTQPGSQERFFGDEGLNDLGISASLLLPTGDVYTKLTVDVLRGSSIGETTGIEDTSGSKPLYANSARLTSFFPLSDESDLEVGASAYTGIHDPYHRDRFWYGNIDFKYKYRPSGYTSLTVQGEMLFNTRKARQDKELNQFVDENGNPERRSINTAGLYLYSDYQFLKTYSIGARYDWSQSPYSKDDRLQAVAVFLGYYPVEETLGMRLQYQYTRTEVQGVSQAVNMIALQAVFSLGPHKAHQF